MDISRGLGGLSFPDYVGVVQKISANYDKSRLFPQLTNKRVMHEHQIYPNDEYEDFLPTL